MARAWSAAEAARYRSELIHLYVDLNLTISEIGLQLGIAPQTVFDRMSRLNIPSQRTRKRHADNRRTDVQLPSSHSGELAEVFGILAGDGHVGRYQTIVTLGSSEEQYARYVQGKIRGLFGAEPRISRRRTGHFDIYLGSTAVTEWLHSEGFPSDKVKAQMDAPKWVTDVPDFMRSFVRGFFDTDGSVYRLRHGIQLSICNASIPLLHSLQNMLRTLGYTPSAISGCSFYLTKRIDVNGFFTTICPANEKHIRRYRDMVQRVGTQVVNEDWL